MSVTNDLVKREITMVLHCYFAVQDNFTLEGVHHRAARQHGIGRWQTCGEKWHDTKDG